MKSLSTYFLNGFDINPSYRPAPTEQVIIGLIYTLAKNNLLKDAIEVIEHYSELVFDGSLEVINNLITDEVITFLGKDESTVKLYLSILLPLLEGKEYTTIPMETEEASQLSSRKLDSAIYALNSLDLGFKVFLLDKQTLGLIRYDDEDELPNLVVKYHITERAAKRIFT